MVEELPAGRGAGGRDGGGGVQADAGRKEGGSWGQTTQDASVPSGARVFILRAMGSHRRALSRAGM